MIQRAYYGISLNAAPATPLIRNKIAIIGTHRRFGSQAHKPIDRHDVRSTPERGH